MSERVCPSCGANNAAGASYCWQCLSRFGAPAGGAGAGGPGRGSALRAALGTGPGAGTPSAVISDPATITRWQPTHGAGPGRLLNWTVAVAVFAAAAVGGYYAWQWLTGGIEFPSQVGGQPRMESEFVETAEDLMTDLAGPYNVEIEIAAYGQGVPQFLLAATDLPEDQLLDQFYQGFAAGSGVSPGFGTTDLEGVTCAGFPGGVGAQCAWVHDDDTIVLLQGFASTDADLRGTAEAVRAELG